MVDSLRLTELDYNLLQLSSFAIPQTILKEILGLARRQIRLTWYQSFGTRPTKQCLVRKRS